MHHGCVACGTAYPQGFHPFCDACGGMVDVTYPLSDVELPESPNPYRRFAALLPISRLHDRLPDTTYTPLVHAATLGRELGMTSLYLKDETTLPTGTTKDRMAAISLAYMNERGVRSFCASSTGNSGTSFAHGICVHPEMHLFLFTAEDFVPRVHYADHPQVTHFGMRDASFVEAAAYAATYARKQGLVSESGFFNPARREGLKLTFLEVSEQVSGPIDWYVQAVSSAMGIYGAHKGAGELLRLNRLERMPRLLCVQQQSCAPMARAFAEGRETILPEHLVARPSGIAEAILRGDPTRAYPHVRRVVLESGGNFVIVTEAEIRNARRRVEECEGLSPCFSASAAVAGVIKSRQESIVPRDAVVVISLTGSDRAATSSSSAVRWIVRDQEDWIAEGPPPVKQPSRRVSSFAEP